MNPLLVGFVFCGAGFGAGLMLIIGGWRTPDVGLAQFAQRLSRDNPSATRPASRNWRQSTRYEQELALCELTVQRWTRDRIMLAAAFAVPALLLTPLAVLGMLSLSPLLLIIAALALGVFGWWYSTRVLQRQAEEARTRFRESISVYLQLVAVLIAGGAGVETAVFEAASVGQGQTWRHLRTALSSAKARQESPWGALGHLGNQLGVRELAELASSITLAAEGSRVADTLVAKAEAMRLHELATQEAAAEARSETLIMPVLLMFIGFTLLISYPMFAGLVAASR